MREIIDHYTRFDERDRLSLELGCLELARTQELISRHLSTARRVILDVGGGPGTYSLWLASLGHEVHLVDPVPKHVEQAAARSARQPEAPVASITLADGRQLPRADATADTILLMGPLYHLTERKERLRALAEARRVLRPGGLLFAAAISRFASLVDGLGRAFIDDPAFARILERDLREGQHRNPTGRIDYFTTGFFHRPEELHDEIAEAGFGETSIYAVEGPAWAVQDFPQRWACPERREQLLDLLRRIEREPSLMGASPHLLAVATAPGTPPHHA